MAINVMIDTMIYDEISRDVILKARLDTLQNERILEFVTTHIQSDQLSRIPQNRDIGQASAIHTRNIATSVLILGYSRLGQEQLGDENGSYSRLDVSNPKNTPDAIIAATALSRADIFVTNDIRLANRIVSLGTSLTVVNLDAFKVILEDL